MPKTKKKTIYCDRLNEDGRTCKDLGANLKRHQTYDGETVEPITAPPAETATSLFAEPWESLVGENINFNPTAGFGKVRSKMEHTYSGGFAESVQTWEN